MGVITKKNITCKYFYDIFTHLNTFRCRESKIFPIINDSHCINRHCICPILFTKYDYCHNDFIFLTTGNRNTSCLNRLSMMFSISLFSNQGNGKQIIQDDAKQGYTIFVVCGSGLAGLVGGILITLLACIFVQKCKDRRCVTLTDIYVREIKIHVVK